MACLKWHSLPIHLEPITFMQNYSKWIVVNDTVWCRTCL